MTNNNADTATVAEIQHEHGRTPIDESLDNKVNSWVGLNYYLPKLKEMCESASRDDAQNMIAPKAYPQHPLWSESVETVISNGIISMLKYLIVHGYSGETIYSQTGHL